MPKIFLTGSGITKGYLTGSGYLNNPDRILTRKDDNMTGRYPTIHRMNRKDNSGILPNVLFNDDHVVNFGTRIKDNFDISRYEDFIQDVDPKKWVSTPGVVVKREFDPSDDLSITTGAVVLGGTGDSEGRWIRTKNKVSKPTLYFDITCGPYNNINNGVLSAFKMRLSQGAITDVLKIQVSTAGTSGTWTTLPIKTSHISSNASQDLISGDGFSTKGTLYGVSANTAGVTTTVVQENKPVLKVKIDNVDFADLGFHDPFYIRFVQPSVSDTSNTVWAIGYIDIISRQDQVKYPTLSKVDDGAGSYFDDHLLASPNVYDGLVTTGSARPRSIVRSTIENEQLNAPFDESRTVNSVNSEFYRTGTKSSVYPGFSSPTLNKTKFEIDLSPSEDIDLGLDKEFIGFTPTSALDASGDGPILMVYWNKDQKKWEKIGKPIGASLNNKPGTTSNYIDVLKSYLTSSAVGFGPQLWSFGSASDGNSTSNGVDIFSKDALSITGKPTDLFSFPYGPQYHATSSQFVTAKDIGITKPFAFEKSEIYLDFNLELQANDYAFNEYVMRTNSGPSAVVQLTHMINILPTFFILRQRKDNFEKTYNIELRGNGISPVDVNDNYNFSIPGNYDIVSGSNDLTYVNTSRDLITYKQPLLTFKFDSFNVDDSFQPNELLELGYPGDNQYYYDENSGIPALEGSQIDTTPVSLSGRIKVQSPVKMSTSYSPVTSLRVQGGIDSNALYQYKLSVQKESADRSNGLLSSQRALLKNVGSFKSSSKFLQPNIDLGDDPFELTSPDYRDIATDSPYVIFPDDELILGWQFPIPRNLVLDLGPRSTPYYGTHKLTFTGNSKLTLYGSQVKDGKEFHEGLNQNLTSNAVHEVIGNEPVIDQWQISARGEMTGSYSDQFMYGTTDTSSIYFAIGSIITNKNLKLGFQNIATEYQDYWEVGNIPERRVDPSLIYTYGLDVVDQNNFSILGSLRDTVAGENDSNTGLSTYGRITPAGGLIKQIQRFTNVACINKVYHDSLVNNIVAETTYGSSQNFTHWINPSNDRITKIGGFSKHYFNSKHYGYMSDLIRQGLDTKFTTAIISRQEIITDPVVKIQFVTEFYDNANLNYRSFKRVKPIDIDGTSYESFQSSNLSIHAVSTVPFFDDGVVRNREYGSDTVEIGE